MGASLSCGTRIGAPQPDGTLMPGTIIGPAFGEGFYRVSLREPQGDRIVCIHRSEIVVEPRFASLAEAAAAMRARDQRVEAGRQLKVAGGAF